MINIAHRRKERFTQIANSCLRDKRISWKAKGLMAYFMSHDVTWIFRESKIIDDSTDGRDSVRAGLKELITFGYLKKLTQTRENGKFSHIEYFINDEIEYDDDSHNNDIPTVDGKSVNGKTVGGKSPTKNKKNKNTNCKNKKEYKERKKKNLNKDFLIFVDSLRNYLRPDGKRYPTLPTKKYGDIGLNSNNRLYRKDTSKDLTAYQAMDVYQSAFNNNEFRKIIYKHML